MRTREFLKWFGNWLELAKINAAEKKISKVFHTASTGYDSNRKEVIGIVSNQEARTINQSTGLNITDGHWHTIDKSAINHALKNHGDHAKEILQGQVGLTEKDFRLIPQILAAPDTIESGDKTKTGLETIKYSKRFNGTIFYVEEVRKGKRNLAFLTMYKRKRKSGEMVSPSTRTSKTTLALPKNIKTNLETQVSKVVDENGEPQIMFHGTQDDVEIFDGNQSSKKSGFKYKGKENYFFTNESTLANDYAKADKYEVDYYNAKPNVIPVFLNIKNPHIVDAQGLGFGAVTAKAIETARRNKNDGVIINNVLDRNGGFSDTATTVIAFDKKQIKSIFNRGSYSNNEDSILRKVADLSDFNNADYLKKLYNKDGEFNYELVRNVAGRIRSGELEITRLTPREEQGRIAGGRRNVEASLISGANAGTNQAKPRGSRPSRKEIFKQNREVEARLKEYAKNEGIWFDYNNFTSQHEYLTSGQEAHVYKEQNKPFVLKVVDYDYDKFGYSPLEFIDNKISLFNYLFPETKYELVGFTRDTDGRFRFILKQPYIDGKTPHPSTRKAFMKKVLGEGFETLTPEQYINPNYHIWDLHLKNLLQSESGKVYVIDGLLELNTPERYLGGLRTYEDFSIRKSENTEKNQDRDVDEPLYTKSDEEKVSDDGNVALRSVTDLSDFNNADYLKKLYNKDGEMNYDQLEKISNGIERGNIKITRLNEEAERGRIEGGRRNVEASVIAGTDDTASSKTRKRAGLSDGTTTSKTSSQLKNS